jgi:hypothetical protein
MHPLVEPTPPVRLTIPGEYWDSQVYAGTLYLFGQSGELITLSWERLVAELPVPAELRVAANAALLGNHSLYEPGARQLVEDPEIRPIVMDKFRRLASDLAGWELADARQKKVQENVLPFPHNDSEMHYNRLLDCPECIREFERRRKGGEVSPMKVFPRNSDQSTTKLLDQAR